MRSSLISALAIALFVGLQSRPSLAADTNRSVTSFDPGWRFKVDVTATSRPAPADAAHALPETAAGFDDSGWRALDLPHDWSIEGPYDRANPSGGAGGFLPDGIGWYRKTFTLTPDDAHRRVFIRFDGVMEHSDVWINGFHLGHRPFGYVSFQYDMTSHLHFDGQKNILAVRVDDSAQPDSRWYSGAGIYRHVWLVKTEPVHLDYGGVFLSTPTITDASATVHVQATVVNDGATPQSVIVIVPYSRPDGTAAEPALDKLKPTTIAPGKSVDIAYDFDIANPARWNLDSPKLYRASVQVRGSDGALIDSEFVNLGIRQIEFKTDTGFWLNGKNMKLLGVCLHNDAGGLGSAVPASVWEQRLTQLKAVGANAIRTSHAPQTPEFLDACDRIGLLVMDEMFDCWTVGKNKFDYHLDFPDWWSIDTRDTVRRDRNHPSVILWSAGNEIRDITANNDLGARVFTGIRDVMHANDPTRPVTMAVLQPNQHGVYTSGFSELMDVVGQNYREKELLAAHAALPSRKIMGTENHHDLPTWQLLRDNPPYIGQFLWTGFDYLGESRGGYPSIGSPAGLYDRTGTLKGQGYQRASWWSASPMVQIVRLGAPAARGVDPADPTQPQQGVINLQSCDWTPNNLQSHSERVAVYSNCDSVELFLNGQSLGAAQDRPKDDSPRIWNVTFAPGEIKAVGTNKSGPGASCAWRTAGKAAKLVVSVDRQSLNNDWDDVAYFRATVVDDKDVPLPTANNLVTFQISGSGVISAVDSGDCREAASYRGNQRKAFGGSCVAIVHSSAASGKITVTASADNLESSSVSLDAEFAMR